MGVLTDEIPEIYSPETYLTATFHWGVDQIEVYQVIPFEPYSVTPLHCGYYFLILF